MEKVFLLFFIFSFGCSSPGKKDQRPYELFEAPPIIIENFLSLKNRSKDEKRALFSKAVKKVEGDWESQIQIKRKKFAQFLKQSKKDFAEAQVQQRDQFVKDKPSREMLGTFLRKQASDQRDFYRKSIADEDFFSRNEKHLSSKFEDYVRNKKKDFNKNLSKIDD